MSDTNPFESAKKTARRQSKSDGTVLAEVEAVSADGSMAAVSNKGESSKYAVRLPEEVSEPPVGSSVMVNTAGSGQAYIEMTMDVPEGETLGPEPDTGIKVFNQTTRPDESLASAGDVWLNRYAYLPRELWQFAPTSGTQMGKRFAIDSNRIYTIDNDGGILWALSYANESYSVEWSVSGITSQDIISDDTGVYTATASDDTIYKFDPSDGTELWSTGISNFARFMGQDGTHIFTEEAGATEPILSVDKSDGTINWRSDATTGGVVTIILTDSDSIYFGDGNEDLISISKSDGSLNWTNTSATSKIYEYGITQDSSNIYFGDSSGNVFVVDKSTGNNVNNGLTSFASNTVTGLEVDDSHMYIGVTGDGIYKHDKLEDDEVFDAFFSDAAPELASNIYLTDSAVYFVSSSLAYKLDLSLNIDWYTNNVSIFSGDPYIEEYNGEVYVGHSDGFTALADERDKARGEAHTFDGTHWFLEQ